MEIAIVEDSCADRASLSGGIKRYCKENQLGGNVCVFEDAQDFIAGFEPERYDVIFMDIYMEKMNGMEAAKRIREQDLECLLVFSTASENHAVESYRVRAFDYLLKPYDYKQLSQVLRLCEEKLALKSRFIEVKEGREQVKILLKDILYTDYYNHYIQIHAKDKIIKTYMKFADFSPMLLRYSNFLCCYRNCVINMDKVDFFQEGGFHLRNGETIPVTRKKQHEIKKQYADYCFYKLERGI